MTQTKEERNAKEKERRDRPEEQAKTKARVNTPESRAKRKEKRDRPEEQAKTKIYMKKWREENREKHRSLSRDWANRTRLERKQKVFSHYSNGSLKCACCGVEGLEFLTIDHVISRKKMELDLQLMNMGYSAKLHGKDLYYWLEDNDFPSGFQILCWNCNFAKGSLGECPHKTARQEQTI